MRWRAAWLALCALLLAARPALAEERISHYAVALRIAPDGMLEVAEAITANAEGVSIKRGLYRDLPERYRGPWGVMERRPVTPVAVQRDGKAEAWHTERTANGLRIYAGQADRMLPHGVHRWTFNYLAKGQIAFHDGEDELYWNVTGNDWAFPIDQVELTVLPPPGAGFTRQEAWTGPRGARGSGWEARTAPDGSIYLRTTGPLAPGEGVTVSLGFTPGVIPRPDPAAARGELLAENWGWLLAVLAGGGAIAWYLLAWALVGRDPPAGTLVARYRPPDGLTPAAVRYLRRMSFDDRCFAAAILSLGAKGSVTIGKDGEDWTLTARQGPPAQPLSAGELAMRTILLGGRPDLALTRANHDRIRRARNALKNLLTAEYKDSAFALNRLWLLPGLALSALALGGVAAAADEAAPTLFMLVWLSFWSFGCGVMLRDVVQRFRGGGIGAGISLIPFMLPFFAGWTGGAWMLWGMIGLPGAAVMLALLLAAALFIPLMRAPSLSGRRLLDQIEGYHHYLTVAEADRIRAAAAETPESLRQHLPYAVALDEEEAWSRLLVNTLGAAAAAELVRQTSWLDGDFRGGVDVGDLGHSLAGGLSATLSHAATSPSSDGGGGGGGSSGGGGGGGGGGGW